MAKIDTKKAAEAERKTKPKLQPASSGPVQASASPPSRGAVATRAASTQVTQAGSFEEDAGAGQEKVSGRDVSIPFIGLLQQMSPQVDKTNTSKYIPGSSPGMLLNTITNDVYDGDTGILLVPCFFECVLIEWVPREKGGGIVKIYQDGDAIEQRAVRSEKGDILPNGNNLVRTAQHYCLLVDEETGDYTKVVQALSSTGLKKSRAWNSLIAGIRLDKSDGSGKFNPASFSHIYRCTTGAEKNNKGSFFNVNHRIERMVDDPALYSAAKEFYKLVSSGAVRAAPPAPDQGIGEAAPVEDHKTY